jgi:hypothetical protein
MHLSLVDLELIVNCMHDLKQTAVTDCPPLRKGFLDGQETS